MLMQHMSYEDNHFPFDFSSTIFLFTVSAHRDDSEEMLDIINDKH
jgi:hypothetical protein